MIYVAPELIAHYIDAHEYRPPDEFVESVLKCPRMSTKEYFKALRRSGWKFKRSSKKLLELYQEGFTASFDKNKKLVSERAEVTSKKLRNSTAGYITRLVKKQQAKKQ